MLENPPQDLGSYLSITHTDGIYSFNAKSGQFLGIKD